MQTLPLYLQRPKIYFRVGFGWNTDRLYDLKIKSKKSLKN